MSVVQSRITHSVNAANITVSPSIEHQVNNSAFGSYDDIHKQSANSRYWQTVDAWTDNLISKLVALKDQGHDSPLFVPITVTFKPMSISDDEVLGEFSRFYVRLTRLLIKNPERPFKRDLLPFTVAWRDDPSTRPAKYQSRPSTFSNHPGVAPHVHALTIIHPSVAQSFLDIAGSLESTWQGIPIGSAPDHSGSPRHRNRTLHADTGLAEEIRNLMRRGSAVDLAAVRNKVRACIAYASKLERRPGSDQSVDVFAVLPTLRPTAP
jgi:hypothetical protein